MIKKLLIVQQHDIKIRDMGKELKDIPARKKQEESVLTDIRQVVAAVEEDIKKQHAGVKKVELEVQARHEKINKLRQQQMSLKTNKEFKAMDQEIEGVQQEIRALEDEQLVIMETLDRLKEKLAAARDEMGSQESAVASDVKLLDDRMTELKKQVQEEQALRDAVAADADVAALQVYERIFERKDIALAKITNGVCGGCHMNLPPAVIHGARQHNVMVKCDFCGRLLY